MAERELRFASRYVRRQFEKAVGKSVVKILTELLTNADDSYSRLGEQPAAGSPPPPGPGKIEILFDRAQRRFVVIDQAEGISLEEMDRKLAEYGAEAASAGAARVRGLFGKGVRDVLYTQAVGQIKSVKNGKSAICKFRWRTKAGQEIPVVDLSEGPRVTRDLRKAWGIEGNGTAAEFRLRDDVPLPQTEKLAEKLRAFYMLRPINANPLRHVDLCIVDRRGRKEPSRLVYRSPEGETLREVRLNWSYEGLPVHITCEICRHPRPLTQGEVGYEDREGGILVIDENNAVLDLTLFGYDEDPYARRLFGTLKLEGAGQVIRRKLNEARPEEILTETRDGFDRKHPFYKELRQQIDSILKPVVEQERKELLEGETAVSEETAKRHKKAFTRLNEIYKEMVGDKGPGGIGIGQRLEKPPGGIDFLRKSLTVVRGLATPTGVIIDPDVIPTGTEVRVSSGHDRIAVDPPSFIVEAAMIREGGVGLKIVRITGQLVGASGLVRASAGARQAEAAVTVVEREVFTPADGLAFSPDLIRVHDGQRRTLRLYIDGLKIAYGERIELRSLSDAIVLPKGEFVFDGGVERAGDIGVADVSVIGYGIGRRGEVVATSGSYKATAEVEVVSRTEREEGLGGRFRGWRFQSLDRKVQTMLDSDGYILVNTNDPLSRRYFGNNPTESVENHPHCQMRLADLILDECLQIMVSEALEAGTIERRFPDNPEIDIRNYVCERKFTYGPEIHAFFLKPAGLKKLLEPTAS